MCTRKQKAEKTISKCELVLHLTENTISCWLQIKYKDMDISYRLGKSATTFSTNNGNFNYLLSAVNCTVILCWSHSAVRRYCTAKEIRLLQKQARNVEACSDMVIHFDVLSKDNKM